MNFKDTVKIPPDVMARQVGDETVILDLASGNYFGLDPVGARIWQLIGEGKPLEAVCETLLDEYEVSAEQAREDLARLVGQLQAQGLVSIA